MSIKAESSRSLYHWLIYKKFISSIVDLCEGVIISAGDTGSGEDPHASETEEVCKVHEA